MMPLWTKSAWLDLRRSKERNAAGFFRRPFRRLRVAADVSCAHRTEPPNHATHGTRRFAGVLRAALAAPSASAPKSPGIGAVRRSDGLQEWTAEHISCWCALIASSVCVRWTGLVRTRRGTPPEGFTLTAARRMSLDAGAACQSDVCPTASRRSACHGT